MRKALAVSLLCAAALSGSAHAIGAGRFNMKVKTSDIRPGRHLVGPELDVAGLANHVVVVSFWAFNSSACRGNLATLEGWHKSLGSQGLVVIGMHIQGGDDDQVKALCLQKKVTFSIYANGMVIGGNDFKFIPHCFLFDHTGKCIYRGPVSGAKWKMEAAVKAAPALVLAGRELKKLAAISDSLKKGTPPGTIIKQLASRMNSRDPEVVDEAKYVVERLETDGRQRLDDAKSAKASDPRGCLKALQELDKEYKNHDIGKEAKALLVQCTSDTAFKKEIEAYKMLEIIQRLEAQVRPIMSVMGADTSSDRFLARNRAVLNQIAQGVAAMKQRYPGCKATEEAKAIAQKYKLM